jgi:hypothetical protein
VEAVTALQRLGVTHAMVHRDAMSPERFAETNRVPAFERVAEEGTLVLYRIKPLDAAPRK